MQHASFSCPVCHLPSWEHVDVRTLQGCAEHTAEPNRDVSVEVYGM